jgi:acyl carrier protein
MERQDIFIKIAELIREVMLTKNLKVELESSLTEDLGIDSLGAVELINAVEDQFKIAINEAEMQAIKTVNDAVKLIIEKTDNN